MIRSISRCVDLRTLLLTTLVFAQIVKATSLFAATAPVQLLTPVRMPTASYLILPEQRFNPAMQRQLAERSLAALPLYNGRLFYIVPSNVDPAEQQAQIQYLEYLLDKNQGSAATDSR